MVETFEIWGIPHCYYVCQCGLRIEVEGSDPHRWKEDEYASEFILEHEEQGCEGSHVDGAMSDDDMKDGKTMRDFWKVYWRVYFLFNLLVVSVLMIFAFSYLTNKLWGTALGMLVLATLHAMWTFDTLRNRRKSGEE